MFQLGYVSAAKFPNAWWSVSFPKELNKKIPKWQPICVYIEYRDMQLRQEYWQGPGQIQP